MTALVVARLSVREVLRRRGVIVLVIALPLWFYLIRRGQTGQSTRMLAIGLGWAISTLTLFVVNAARRVDPRLRVLGAPVTALAGGRMLAMTAAGCSLALGYWLLVAVDQDVRRLWAIGPMMLLSALVSVPFGALIGVLLPRELEGALALLSVVAVQMLADPQQLAARLLPLWSVRQLGTYAVDGTPAQDAWLGLLHAAVTWAVCTAGTLAVSAHRLRLARYPEPADPAGAAGGGLALG